MVVWENGQPKKSDYRTFQHQDREGARRLRVDRGGR
jgi:excinuclease UvrABC nuclease subunit